MTSTPFQLASNVIASKIKTLNSLKTQLVSLQENGQTFGKDTFSAADYLAALSPEQKSVFEGVIAAIPD